MRSIESSSVVVGVCLSFFSSVGRGVCLIEFELVTLCLFIDVFGRMGLGLMNFVEMVLGMAILVCAGLDNDDFRPVGTLEVCVFLGSVVIGDFDEGVDDCEDDCVVVDDEDDVERMEVYVVEGRRGGFDGSGEIVADDDDEDVVGSGGNDMIDEISESLIVE